MKLNQTGQDVFDRGHVLAPFIAVAQPNNTIPPSSQLSQSHRRPLHHDVNCSDGQTAKTELTTVSNGILTSGLPHHTSGI